MLEVKTEDLKKLLTNKTHETGYIFNGTPGVGKVEELKEIAKEINYNLISIDPFFLNTEDFTGLPLLKNHQFSVPVLFNNDDKKGTILFFDGIEKMTASCYDLLKKLERDRKINNHTLNDNTQIICCKYPSEYFFSN